MSDTPITYIQKSLSYISDRANKFAIFDSNDQLTASDVISTPYAPRLIVSAPPESIVKIRRKKGNTYTDDITVDEQSGVWTFVLDCFGTISQKQVNHMAGLFLLCQRIM